MTAPLATGASGADGAARSERSALVALALPLAAQQVGFVAMGIVDAALLGRYSNAALAGAGVANNLLFAVSATGMGIVMGMDTVVPQALGAGRPDDARRALAAGLRLAVIVGLVATLAVFASPWVLDAAAVDRDVVAEARPYIFLRAVGVVPFLISIAQRSYLMAHGRTRPLVLAVTIGNVVNALLDLALIYGVPALHLPRLGVIGAALATTFVQLVTCAVYALAIRALDGGVAPPRAGRTHVMDIVRYGLPVGGQMLAEVGIFGVATVCAARLGELPADAHTVALNVSSLTFSFSVGVASAASVRVGHAVGAGDIALARRRGFAAIRLGLAVMGAFAAVFVLAPAAIATLFTRDAAVVSAAVPLFYIAALFQLSDGTQAIGAGALRGLGDTTATLVANLVGHYAVGLPILLALGFAAHLGAPGLWIGLSCGLTVTALYLVYRFVRATRPRPD